MLALVALALACGLGAWSDDAGRAAAGPAAVPDGSRIASVRVYQGGRWTVPGETAASVGTALAQLEPSLVSAPLRFRAGASVRNKEVEAWNTIRSAVTAASPSAGFEIELNALEYPTIKRLNAMMAKLRARFDNDGWLFDFYTPAAKREPKVMAAAVANAHANGEWLGGNAFGIARHPRIPAGTDYVAVQDFGFRIDLDAVRKLATRAPVFFHLGNSPGFPGSDGCLFIEKLSTAKRQDYVRRRARQQAQYDFRFSYPIFFPECARNRGTRRVEIFTYNAVKDAPMMATIGELMDRYE